MCLCVYVIILVNGFAPRSAPRFAPFTLLTLPITIHCQSTPHALVSERHLAAAVYFDPQR